MRWMRGMMIGSSLLLIGGGCGHTPERQVPDCTNCVLEIRNQRGVELELRMNDFSAGPAIGVIGAGEVRRFTVERRPDRLYGIYYRDMQRYVLTCELRSMAAEAYVYTCPER